MTIWLINHYALTPDQAGGTRHYDIAQELVRRGDDVTIIASGFHYALFREMKQYPPGKDFLVEMIDGVRFVWIKTGPYRGNGIGRVRNMLEFTWKLGHLSESDLLKPDVVVGSSVHLFAVYGAYRLAKHLKVPFVMEVRDIWPQTLIDMGVSKYHPFVLLLGWLEPFLYRRADAIITLLPRAADHIEKFGVSSNKVTWISNGVNIRSFENVVPSQRLNPKKFNVLYTGTMGTANNLEPLMDAAEMLEDTPNIALTLVGSGPLKNDLEQRAKLLSNSTLIPSIPKTEIAGLLKEADVLFVGLKNLPLYRFGMSMNKVFDYMAAAKPIVFATNVPDNPVQIAKAGIIVPPDDARAIAKAVRTLYNDTIESRESMGENGYHYVKAHFSMTVITTKFESVLKKAKNGN